MATGTVGLRAALAVWITTTFAASVPTIPPGHVSKGRRSLGVVRLPAASPRRRSPASGSPSTHAAAAPCHPDIVVRPPLVLPQPQERLAGQVTRRRDETDAAARRARTLSSTRPNNASRVRGGPKQTTIGFASLHRQRQPDAVRLTSHQGSTSRLSMTSRKRTWECTCRTSASVAMRWRTCS